MMETLRERSANTAAERAYITDLNFASGYVRHQQPVTLSAVAALAGIVPPDPAGPYSYLELGCGEGFMLAGLAAANPLAEFTGVDFNRHSVEIARRRAKSADLSNVSVIEAAFDDLRPATLPQFDYIAIQGAYSWLDPASLAAVHEIIRHCLKPGGVFYVEYMSLPGKAAIAPLWYFLRKATDGHDGDSRSRLLKGAAMLARLQNAGAAYLVRNEPASYIVSETLRQIRQSDRSVTQIAHNALAEHWRPEYFSTIRDRLRALDLEFAGSSNFSENDTQALLPARLREIVDAFSDPAAIELVKDFFDNRQVRHDIFVKRPVVDPEAARTCLQDRMWVVPMADRAACLQQLESGGVEGLGLSPEDIDGGLDRLFDGTPRVADFLVPSQTETGLTNRLSPVLARTLELGAAVLSRAAPMAEMPDGGASIRPGSRFNANALATTLDELAPACLASPVLGGCIPVPPLPAASLALMAEAGTSDLPTHKVVARIRGLRGDVVTADGLVPAAQLGRNAIARNLRMVTSKIVPTLLRLGVLISGETPPR